MQIELRKMNSDKAACRQLHPLYMTAFPAPERAPFSLLMRKAKKSIVDWWGVYNGERCVGFFYMLHEPGLAYVFYFAICEEERGKGYGSLAIKALKEAYPGERVFLAIEQIEEDAPNYTERVNRKQFYQKNGFEELHSRVREGNVIYELLGIGGAVSPQEYKKLIVDWIGNILCKLIRMEILS